MGPNNAMIESLLILPSVTELLVAVASLVTDSEAVVAGDTDVVIDDDDTAGADTNPLNSELRPSRSWAEALLGTLEAVDEGVADDVDDDSDNPSKSDSRVLADFTIDAGAAVVGLLTTAGAGLFWTVLTGAAGLLEDCLCEPVDDGTVRFLNSGFLSMVVLPASSQPLGNWGGVPGLHSDAIHFFFSYLARMKASTAWSF